MAFTVFEKDLLKVSILQSIDGLNSDPNRNKPNLKDGFDNAIKARNDLIDKVMREL